jgi:hypothetical protein
MDSSFDKVFVFLANSSPIQEVLEMLLGKVFNMFISKGMPFIILNDC